MINDNESIPVSILAGTIKKAVKYARLKSMTGNWHPDLDDCDRLVREVMQSLGRERMKEIFGDEF